jgi:hypothetical protein
VALEAAFDKPAQRKEPCNCGVLATQSDGSLMKPNVTSEQLAAVAFKVNSFMKHKLD